MIVDLGFLVTVGLSNELSESVSVSDSPKSSTTWVFGERDCLFLFGEHGGGWEADRVSRRCGGVEGGLGCEGVGFFVVMMGGRVAGLEVVGMAFNFCLKLTVC